MALEPTGDTTARALARSPGCPPSSIPRLGRLVTWGGVSGPLCGGPTGHIVLHPHLKDSGPQSSYLRPPPWPFASEPRLGSRQETGGRAGDPHRESIRAKTVGAKGRRGSQPHHNSNKNKSNKNNARQEWYNSIA